MYSSIALSIASRTASSSTSSPVSCASITALSCSATSISFVGSNGVSTVVIDATPAPPLLDAPSDMLARPPAHKSGRGGAAPRVLEQACALGARAPFHFCRVERLSSDLGTP